MRDSLFLSPSIFCHLENNINIKGGTTAHKDISLSGAKNRQGSQFFRSLKLDGSNLFLEGNNKRL